MFAVIYIPQFSLQAALRHQPGLWAKPIALVDPARTNPVVCDLTDPARHRGVTEGLTPTQALARCGELMVRHRSLSQETSLCEAVLQCCYGFSPNIEATAPGVCTLDLRGLAALSADDTSTLVHWSSQLRTTLTGYNLRVRIGVGS